MSSKVVRFVPRAARAARAVCSEAAELVRASGALTDTERSIVLRGLAKMSAPPASETSIWQGLHTMLNRAQTRAAWAAINALPGKDRPVLVRRVFDEVLLSMEFDSGEVPLTREQLAERVGALPRHVSEAMTVLERIGVVVRWYERVPGMRGRGRAIYAINPHVAWTGNLDVARERAKASGAQPVQLRLVD